MFKKTITYENYNGTKVEEDFYFNLSKYELQKLEATTPGGFVSKLETIQKAQDVKEIYTQFNDIVDLSYGRKSEDGRFFQKSEEILAEFKSTAAYDQLMFDLFSDPDQAVLFVNGILPKDITQNAELEKVINK